MSDAGRRTVVPPDRTGEHSIRPYDFLHPDRLSRRQLRALEEVHREAAGVMASKLTMGEDGHAEVRFGGITQVGAQDFVAGLPRPTVIEVLALTPMMATGLFQLDVELAFLMVNLLMGGRRESPPVSRPPTELEHAILKSPIATMIDCASQAWARLGPLRLALAPDAPAPHFSLIGQPQDPVLVARFSVSIGGETGNVTLGLPLLALERARLLEPDRLEMLQRGPSTHGGVGAPGAQLLGDVPVRCVARLAEFPMTLHAIRSLGIGDVLMLSPVSAVGMHLVGGDGCRLRARLLTQGRRLAAEVLEPDSTMGALP